MPKQSKSAKPQRPRFVNSAVGAPDADALIVEFFARRLEYWLPKGGHWHNCPVDLAHSSVQFGVGVGGGCPACAHVYDEVQLVATCGCSKRRTKIIDDDVSYRFEEILAGLAGLAEQHRVADTAGYWAGEQVRTEIDGLDERRDASVMRSLRRLGLALTGERRNGSAGHLSDRHKPLD